MVHVLLAGESWVSSSTHFKGFDQFTSVTFETGSQYLVQALDDDGIEVTYLPGHEVPQRFPSDRAALSRFDVVIISDIGANSILLHPDTFLHGRPTANRLRALADWVTEDGGGLVMAGGYLSFQGIEGKAAYRGTPVEEVLPVTMEPWDDRVETPEGAHATVTDVDHPVLRGVPASWPALLGYNRVHARADAAVLSTVGDDPLLVVGTAGRGRSVAWASDIAPHWCPVSFVEWPGYARLMTQMVRWAAGSRVAAANGASTFTGSA